ncbi:MAG: hypothetical protein ACO28O_07590, partial [Crocinitomicaceae bacterium]
MNKKWDFGQFRKAERSVAVFYCTRGLSLSKPTFSNTHSLYFFLPHHLVTATDIRMIYTALE